MREAPESIRRGVLMPHEDRTLHGIVELGDLGAC